MGTAPAFLVLVFLSAVPPPCEGPQAGGYLQSTPKDPPSPSSGTSHLALGVRPPPLPARWGPQTPFLRGRDPPTHTAGAQ